jgi:N-acetyl-gamma-glutamyl-phosphate reductase / acetylglutamate kinase
MAGRTVFRVRLVLCNSQSETCIKYQPLFALSSFEELYSRDAIRTAKRISNPGCYATAVQMLIAPLLPHAAGQPTVFGLSGYSGAGTVGGPDDGSGRPTTLPKVTPESLHGAVRPYALTDHIHEREAGRHLSTLGRETTVAFTPAVGGWFSGIVGVASVGLSGRMDARSVRELFEEKYGQEKLVRILKGVPEISDIQNKHGFVTGGFQVHSGGERAVIVVRLIFFLSSTPEC